MRVRVQSTWRTRMLLVLAIVAAGIIAWFQVERRQREHEDEERERRSQSYEVEVELAE